MSAFRNPAVALFITWLILTPLLEGHAAAEENRITHGPILGRLSAHGIGVWVRTARPGEFFVCYGESLASEQSATGRTRLNHDNTGWVPLTNLKANTKYQYEVHIPGKETQANRSGSFRTLPDSADFMDSKINPRGLFNFNFEFACGNNQNPGFSIGPTLPALATMRAQLKDKIHFAILNGDWLYEAERDYTLADWLTQVGVPATALPGVLQVAPTLAGVWQNYKHFLDQGANLRAWHREIPSFFTYDDHEILNDVWGAGTPGLRDRRAVFRDIGVRAWYDYLGWSNPTEFQQPIRFGSAQLTAAGDVLTDATADFTKLDLQQCNNLHVHWGTKTAGVNDNALDGVGGDPNAGVYDIVKILDRTHLQIAPAAKTSGNVSYSIGRRSYYRMRLANCEFFILDTRGQRQMHDVARPDKPGLSMLGEKQREWLLAGISDSDADFIFVVSSVNFMVPHVGGGKVRATNKDDAWTVFLDERERLIAFWDRLDKPVFVLTGDLHNSFAIQITDNVWEFASGPHNSQNHRATDEGDRPPNGKFHYGPRPVQIRWSTYFGGETPRSLMRKPTYCVVQVNNVFDVPQEGRAKRWQAFPRPQVLFRYYDGLTGELQYAESILANEREPLPQ